MDLASAWLRGCLEGHAECSSDAKSIDGWLPTRLVDVGEQFSPALRLVEGSRLPTQTPYAALSHRWGNAKQPRLTGDVIISYQDEVPEADLSLTGRQAAPMTRALSLRYLCLDSMGIIQDNVEDWQCEAATMDQGYGHATCTIAAAHAANSNAGCFSRRDPFSTRLCEIPNPFSRDPDSPFVVRLQYLSKNIPARSSAITVVSPRLGFSRTHTVAAPFSSLAKAR